jgi:hypothetical protein
VKKTAFAALLFLVTLANVSSQTFRLHVENKPLSRVLPMLGVEISFDDSALSVYNVSVAESFGSPEEALYRLLADKPFHIEKIGSVYVVVPSDRNGRQDTAVTLYPEKERFIFKGTVIDRSTREPLEYATVSFPGDDNTPPPAGVTTGGGRFRIRTHMIPVKIKISYLGYETLLKDVRSRDGELGVFPLEATVIPLEETVVTADRMRTEINRTRYAVTPQMRDGVTNAPELLNKIPGAHFDRLSETVRINHHDNILLLVDGMQYPLSYLKYLSPHRIHAVELVHAPSGRFVSDDYEAIVNFTLAKDYAGYDIHASNAISPNLSGADGHSRRTENRTGTGITYSTGRLNVFGTCSYDKEDRHMHASKLLTYNQSELASLPAERPNNGYEHERNTLTGGLNYQLTPEQTVAIQGDYTSGNVYDFQEYTMRRTDLTQNRDRILKNTTEILTTDKVFTGTLSYRGQFAGRLHLYGDFSYNYYYNRIENEYNQNDAANYLDENTYNEYKNQTVFNTEAKYLLSGNLSVESGYSNIRRRYASGSSTGRGFLDYREYRNKAFAYLSCYPSDRVAFKSGVALEQINTQDREVKSSYLSILPFFRIDYRINRSADISASYATNRSYPALYQLSPMAISIDTFLTQIGNPALKSAVRHHAFVEFSLWNKLKITPQVCFIRDAVSEVYERKEFKLYRTFNNIHTREYSLQAACDQTPGDYFRLKNALTFYYGEAEHDGIRNSVNGWLFLSEISGYFPQQSAGMQLGYYRNMRKNILWQGYQMSGRDYWCVSAQKGLWRNRISVMLSYIPPVTWGVRYDRTKEMDTPLYKEKTTLNMDTYRQMLLLRIDIRLGQGSVKPARRRNVAQENEREKPSAGF